MYTGSLILLCIWGSCAHEIKLEFLLSVCLLPILLFDQSKEPEEAKVNFSLSPHKHFLSILGRTTTNNLMLTLYF